MLQHPNDYPRMDSYFPRELYHLCLGSRLACYETREFCGIHKHTFSEPIRLIF